MIELDLPWLSDGSRDVTGHFQEESTDTVIAPASLGRMGTRIAEIAALAPENRPLDLYAALAEVAR